MNVALLPASQDYVSINSVNFNHHPEHYIHNERPEDIANCHLTNTASSFQQTIEYDGFTRVLTAVVRLQPCQRYHIRLVVGDVGDAFFDSAVFLEAGSFNIGSTIEMEPISASAGLNRSLRGVAMPPSDSKEVNLPT
ncbi:MAG: choice-of-anchor L domain-containing protein [Saprospiraceae bacterium]